MMPYWTLCAQADAGASLVADQDAVRWDDWWQSLAHDAVHERRVGDEKVLPQWIGYVLIFDVHPAAGRRVGPVPEAQAVGGEDGGSWAAFVDQMTVPPSNVRSPRTTQAYDVYRSPSFYLPHGTAPRQLFATQDGFTLIYDSKGHGSVELQTFVVWRGPVVSRIYGRRFRSLLEYWMRGSERES
ncbi:hypothetical protein K466DRAFT_201661 [Polyporus arcularius HHB13444]|uniref:Uncharacterized protein n=1 Tax=Polyporus arcularius HHB13444 TaxID=1314778 RepID=A0A5C3P6L0_9APHY|nr:hypothetical protein K466DRAFT_201661 [Polyporus arcularius HHB13444]